MIKKLIEVNIVGQAHKQVALQVGDKYFAYMPVRVIDPKTNVLAGETLTFQQVEVEWPDTGESFVTYKVDTGNEPVKVDVPLLHSPIKLNPLLGTKAVGVVRFKKSVQLSNGTQFKATDLKKMFLTGYKYDGDAYVASWKSLK